MPSGERRLVVDLIGRIPAKDHVAEFEAGLQSAEKFVTRHVLSTDDAVEIDHPQFDVGQAPRLHQ